MSGDVRTIAISVFLLAGCIDEFRGSNIELDFSPTTGVQASAYRAALPDELPSNIHFTLYAFKEAADPTSGQDVSYLFEIQKFEIHRVADFNSPCFIDVGDHVLIPGLHVSKYADEVAKLRGIPDYRNPPDSASEQDKIDVATAVQRQANATAMAGEMGPKALTSVSIGGYGAVATSCDDTNGIPPPDCVDAASNQRRLQMCEAEWDKDPAYYEGTDRVLTAPLNGTAYGMVTGLNPVNFAPIGGSAFFVDEALDDFDGYALYWQYDDADKDGMPDYPPSVPSAERNKLGVLYMHGKPEKNITRGVIRTHMRNLTNADLNANLAIFAGIDDDDVHF